MIPDGDMDLSRPLSSADLETAAEGRPHLWAPVMSEALTAPVLGGWRDKRVLEVGFGRGRYAALLASLGARVTAVEIEGHTLDEARRYAVSRGVEARCRFMVADFFELDETYDRIVTKSVLYSGQGAVAGGAS